MELDLGPQGGRCPGTRKIVRDGRSASRPCGGECGGSMGPFVEGKRQDELLSTSHGSAASNRVGAKQPEEFGAV